MKRYKLWYSSGSVHFKCHPRGSHRRKSSHFPASWGCHRTVLVKGLSGAGQNCPSVQAQVMRSHTLIQPQCVDDAYPRYWERLRNTDRHE